MSTIRATWMAWYDWNPPSQRLKMVSETCSSEKRLHLTMPQWWLLDAPLTPCGRYRVGGEGNPWREREPQACYLFPPGIELWEDTTDPGLTSFRYAFAEFDGADSRLRRMVDNPGEHVRFIDSDGLVANALCHAARTADRCGYPRYWQAFGAFQDALELVKTLIRMRIALGKEMLLQHRQCKVIAQRLGFNDEAHFSKTFKRIAGVSPRRFLQTEQVNEGK